MSTEVGRLAVGEGTVMALETLAEQVQGEDQPAGEQRDGLLFLCRTFPSVGFLLRRHLLCKNAGGVVSGDLTYEELLKLVDVQHLNGIYVFQFPSLPMSLMLQLDQDQSPLEGVVLLELRSVLEIGPPQLLGGQVKRLGLHQSHHEVGSEQKNQ